MSCTENLILFDLHLERLYIAMILGDLFIDKCIGIRTNSYIGGHFGCRRPLGYPIFFLVNILPTDQS